MRLWTLRAWVSAAVLLLFGFLYLGGEKLSGSLSGPLMFFQFVPSLLRQVFSFPALSAMGVILVLLLTLLFGRIYCAVLCPLGILQDALIFLSRRFHILPVHRHVPELSTIRNAFFWVTFLSLSFGSPFFLNLLDPVAIFGKITVCFMEPALYGAKKLLIVFFALFDTYPIHLSYPWKPSVPLVALALPFLLAITIFSLLAGRLYCNSVCPVGTLLGFISRFSLFRIEVDREKCIACGRCEERCRAGCMAVPERAVDHSRCTACFDCLPACPVSAVRFGMKRPKAKRRAFSISRRKLVGAAAGGGLLLFTRPFAGRAAPEKSVPVTPPGSKGPDRFRRMCTACYLCVASCPTKVIGPAGFAFGIEAFLQPVMDFNRGYCDYECNLCGRVCPSGAIAPLPLEKKKRTQIGRVALDKKLCITHAKKQNCGACMEVCPTHAVYSVIEGKILYPETRPDICTGCGACQHVCPTHPESIVVTAGRRHMESKPPVYEKAPAIAEKPDDGEFPF